MNVMATPTKRRVLGSLDVNVQMSPRSPKAAGSPLKKATSREATAAVLSRHASPSPRKASSRAETPKKRVLEEGGAVQQPVVKKLCSDSTSATERGDPAIVEAAAKQHATIIEDGAPSQPAAGRRSMSPEASELFDTSGMNTSQDTTITEPDTDAPITITAAAPVSIPSPASDRQTTSLPSPPPPPSRRMPTREEFRQKAEILRLRLSLATYKVKTGQADVPLEKLQVRPVPGMTRRRTPMPSMSAHTIQQSTPAQQWYRSRGTPLPGGDDCVAAGEEVRGEKNGDEATEEQEYAEGSTGDDVASARNPSPPAETETEMERNVLPRLPPPSAVSTPRKRRNEDEEEARLTSSALRGGAAKGLLSLSQGSL